MKHNLISYTTMAGRADENQELIEAVFRELEAVQPAGISYLALRLGDGSFVHFVGSEAGSESVTRLAAFTAFQRDIRARVVEAPLSRPAAIVGNYRMLR